MNDIRTLLKLAARRIELSTFLRQLHACLIIAASIALILMIADRVTAAAFVPWMWIASGIAVVALVTAWILWLRNRHSDIRIAIAVDDRLDLREKLSTALHCQKRSDAFAQAAVEDAVNTARDARIREQVKRHFKVQAPTGWWASPLLIVAALLLSFLKPLNLFEREHIPEQEVIQARNEADESLNAVVKSIQEKSELNKELADALGNLARDGTDPDALRTPEEIKRDALKKVTDLNKKLEDIMSGEKGKTSDALEKAMKGLKAPQNSEAKDLVDAMARGDYSDAQEQLRKLMEKIQSGDLTEEQKQNLAEQLEQIAEQLKELAKKQEELENALKQAGLDPQLAQNPQALEQAIQNNPNLNDQQKQQLMQMARAQQAANQMCEGLGQGMGNLAEALQGLGDLNQAGQQVGDQLAQMEMLEQLLREAQAAAGALDGQCEGLGQGLTMQQALQQWKQGGAFGSHGQGAGGKAPRAPTPTGKKLERAKVEVTDGEVIARHLFDGPQIRGESQAKAAEVVREANEGFDEALSEDQLPRKYHETIKHYFGELEELARAVEVESPAEPVESEENSDENPSETSSDS